MDTKTVLIDYPPCIKPIPFKPVLFDIAYDGLVPSEDIEEDNEEEQKEKQESNPTAEGGIMGLLSGFWSK